MPRGKAASRKRKRSADSGDGDKGGKTVRVQIACVACHKRKMKCDGDGDSPCSYCVKQGIRCQYYAPKKRGPKQGEMARMREEIKYLRDRLAAYEGYNGSGAGMVSSHPVKGTTAAAQMAVAGLAGSGQSAYVHGSFPPGAGGGLQPRTHASTRQPEASIHGTQHPSGGSMAPPLESVTPPTGALSGPLHPGQHPPTPTSLGAPAVSFGGLGAGMDGTAQPSMNSMASAGVPAGSSGSQAGWGLSTHVPRGTRGGSHPQQHKSRVQQLQAHREQGLSPDLVAAASFLQDEDSAGAAHRGVAGSAGFGYNRRFQGLAPLSVAAGGEGGRSGMTIGTARDGYPAHKRSRVGGGGVQTSTALVGSGHLQQPGMRPDAPTPSGASAAGIEDVGGMWSPSDGARRMERPSYAWCLHEVRQGHDTTRRMPALGDSVARLMAPACGVTTETRFYRLFHMFLNTMLPMVSKETIYLVGLRLYHFQLVDRVTADLDGLPCVPIGCSELVFVNRAGEVSGSDAGNVPMVKKPQPSPEQVKQAAAIFMQTGRAEATRDSAAMGAASDGGAATGKSSSSSEQDASADAPTPYGLTPAVTPAENPVESSSSAQKQSKPAPSPSGPDLAMAGAFCAKSGVESAVVAATLGVEESFVGRLAASAHVTGSGGPPNGAEQLAAVAIERTRHDYIAEQLRSKARGIRASASSGSLTDDPSSGPIPLSPGIATALSSYPSAPYQTSVQACEAMACLLCQEAAMLQGKRHWRPLPRDVMACIALNNAILATGARMDGETRLADFFASRARVALAACLDRPSEICVSALLCLAYYLMGVAGDGDTSQARLLIALANEMVDVLGGAGAVRHNHSSGTATAGASAGSSGEASSSSSSSSKAADSVPLPVYKPIPLSRAYSSIPLDIVLTARFLGQLNTVPRGNPMHLKASTAKSAASPKRRSSGLKRTTSAESQTGSMAEDAEGEADGIDVAVARAEAASGGTSKAFVGSQPKMQAEDEPGSEHPVPAGTARTTESDSSAASSSARSDEAQAASSGFTNPRAQVSRILNYVTYSIRRRRWEAKYSRHSADDLLRYLSAGEDLVTRYTIASVMNYTVMASLYTLRSVVYLQCNEKEQALEYAERAVASMMQEKVPFVSYMTMTVFSRVLQVLIPYGSAERVEQVMHLLSATSSVWPVAAIYLARARKRIAATAAAKAAADGKSRGSSGAKSSEEDASVATSGSSSSAKAGFGGADARPEQQASGQAGILVGRKSRFGVDGELPVAPAVSSTHALGSDPLKATGLLLPSTARIMMVGNSDGLQAAPDAAVGDGTRTPSTDGAGIEAGQTPALQSQYLGSHVSQSYSSSAAVVGTMGLIALQQAIGLQGSSGQSVRPVAGRANDTAGGDSIRGPQPSYLHGGAGLQRTYRSRWPPRGFMPRGREGGDSGPVLATALEVERGPIRSDSVEFMASAGGDDDVQLEGFPHFMTNDLLPDDGIYPLTDSPVALPGDLGTIDAYPASDSEFEP